MANSAIHFVGVNKWVVSWTQAFAMLICLVASPGKCLRVKADMVLIAGNTVWSISQCIRRVSEDALYKSTLPLPYLYLNVLILTVPVCRRDRLESMSIPTWRLARHQRASWHVAAADSTVYQRVTCRVTQVDICSDDICHCHIHSHATLYKWPMMAKDEMSTRGRTQHFQFNFHIWIIIFVKINNSYTNNFVYMF